jgi:hypothetical protein
LVARIRRLIQSLGEVLGTAVGAAMVLVEKPVFPLALLALVLLFLVIQDVIDRRDPKLALAPVYAEADLPFVPPPSQSEDHR